jgi:putative endonuclease
MPTRRSATGQLGEDLAAAHLIAAGYTVLVRNWRPAEGRGELDIVADHAGVLVIVEVRTRHGESFGAPEETITAQKRAKLIQTGQCYLREHAQEEANWRIDVIAIDLDNRNAVRRLTHLEHAVTLTQFPGG